METLLLRLLRRPVAVTAGAVLVLGLAGMALLRLPVALLPSLSYPSLLIWTPWPEASPQQVEDGVTERVEEAVAGVGGVTSLTSRSQLGGSLVRLDFGWNTDLDLAALNVRQKLDRALDALPETAERPLVLRVNPSDRPILVLALGSETGLAAPTPAELIELKHVGEEVVARRLEQLDGIARVRVTGAYSPEIQVEVLPDRMAAYGVDLLRVETALRDANVTLAGGTLLKGPFRYAVEVSGELRDADEVARTVVSPPGRAPVRLAELARVKDTVARRRGLVRYDGRETLLLLVERRPDANTVQAAAEAREALGDLRRELPGVSLDVVVDESVFIGSAIGGVLQALLGGGLLAVLVLFLFLRRPRMLAAVAVAVPLSLALALICFDLAGVTLNLISLSGLALGVGLLVDNSIVVVENIARLREGGLSPAPAAARGAAEVAGAITASTLTTLAVFLPLTFVEGLAGRLFRDQSLAVVFSVGASLLVALTVVPLIASRDRRLTGEATAPKTQTRAHHSPLALYERALDHSLAHPRRVLGGALAFLVLTVGVALALPREVIPETEEGRLLAHLTLPPDADLGLVDARARTLEQTLRDLPEVAHVLADLGERDDARLDLDPRPGYEGELTVILKPGAHSATVRRRLALHSTPPDVAFEVRPVKTQLEALVVQDGADLSIDLVAENRAHAEALAPALLEALAARPELANVNRADPQGVPGYDLHFDRDALARLGVQPQVLDAYLEAAARGREATRLQRMRDDIPVVLRTPAVDSVAALLARPVPVAERAQPLSRFTRAEEVSLPALLLRHDQAPVLRLLADLAPGVNLTAGLEAVEAVTADLLPAGLRARVGGAGETFHRSLRAVAWSLLLSVGLVYLILAGQFESLTQPLVVLAVVPLAIGGVALTLAPTGHSWNLMSLTGCVVLVGIVVNDAILKVDCVNRHRAQGRDLQTAIRAAGHERFRPIVMTTLTTALGLLPLALGWGAGGELQASLAVSVVGGVSIGMIFSLLLVPHLLNSCFRILS